MYRRAFARHRLGAALLLGLAVRAPSASAEPAEPDESRVGTVEGKAAAELPSAAETHPSPAAPIVASGLIRDEGVAYPEQALGERFYERVEVRLNLELDASGHFRSSKLPGVAEAVIHWGLVEPAAALSRTASSSLFGVGGLSESRFARGRGGLLPTLLSWLSPAVKLDSRDHPARTTFEPSARDRFSAFGFGSYDLQGDKRNGLLERLGDACRPRITFTW